MSDQIANQQLSFEQIKHTENKLEFWFARELMPLLGYSKWENFSKVIEKAKVACQESGFDMDDQFPDVRNVASQRPQGGGSIPEDYKLTRYACYLIAMNGDSSKKQIADAQTYFAIQTRKQELATQNIDLGERKNLRKQSKESYKSYNSTLVENGVNEGQIGIITSMGDKALFGKKTAKIKEENDMPNGRPLEDFLHPANVTARMLGREMTKLKVESNKIKTLGSAISTHTKHNKEIRQVLLDNEIEPEELPMLEDIKGEVETKQLKKDDKNA
jgi:DNA-damage-inducible protein D